MNDSMIQNKTWGMEAHDQSTPEALYFVAHCQQCQSVIVSETETVLADPATGNAQSLAEQKKELWTGFIQENFRYCKGCQNWVCRNNCWEPIGCLCELCVNPTLTQQTGNSSSSEQVYSSILGGICQHCHMVLPTKATHCPECGIAVGN